MKQCTKCEEQKTKDSFYNDRQKSDGLSCWCKSCQRKRGKKYREKNKERLNKKARQKHKERARYWRSVSEKEWRAIEEKESKKCTNCNEVKLLKRFHRHIGHTDGHGSMCKECKAKIARKEYKKNPEKFRERGRRYRRENKEKRNEYYKRRREENPNWQKARVAVFYAVENGEIPHINTQPCSWCGEPAEHYHHHKGYERESWLDVIPLCAMCHAEERRKY